MRLHKLIIILASFIMLLVSGYIFVNHKAKQAAIAAISSFEECGKYFPIMESYPEQCRTPDGRNFVNDKAEPVVPPVQNDQDVQDARIHVTSPTSGTKIKSPLSIRGEARGTWYFEASFPIKLIDENGEVIAQTHAEAQGEWMTENFVPFLATLTFPATSTGSGLLILERDNPSDLPQNAAEVQIPVSW